MNETSIPSPIAEIVDTDDFSLTLVPAYTLDFDKGDHFVNLAESGHKTKDKDKDKNQEREARAAPSQLNPNPGTSGYRYLQRRKITFGFAPEFDFAWAALPNFGLSVALIPIKGKTAAADRFVKTKEDAAHLPPIRLPFRAADLSTWHESDNMTFASRGGVFAIVGATYFFNSLAGVLVAEGEWIVYVEKRSPTKVYVKITKKKLASLSLQLTNAVSALSVAMFGEHDNNFSYEFDTSDPVGANAYEHMLQGDLLPTQQAESAQSKAVTHINTQAIASKGFLRNFVFSLPFVFNTQHVAGRVYAFSDEILYKDGTHSWVNYAAFIRQSGTGGSHSKHLNRSSTFIAYHQLKQNQKGSIVDDYAGRFKWIYARDHVTACRFERKLDELQEITGLEQELAVTSAGVDLGYADLGFTAKITRKAADHLMANALRPGIFGGWERCSEARGTQNAFETMRLTLVEMNSLRASNPREFAKAFARFGKAMVHDSCTFRGALFATRHDPIEMTFMVNGENVEKFSKKIEWKPQAFPGARLTFAMRD